MSIYAIYNLLANNWVCQLKMRLKDATNQDDPFSTVD